MKFIKKIVMAVLLVAAANQAQATVITNSFGLTSPGQTLTFSEAGALAENTVITNQFAAYGVTFSGGWDFASLGSFPNISGDTLNNFPPGNTPLFIEFASQQTAAAFAMVTNTGTSTFSALLGGTVGSVVESFSSATNITNTSNFFGFEGITFDTIKIEVNAGNNAVLFDNLQFNAVAVPEPTTLALLSLGLVGLGFGRRRKL